MSQVRMHASIILDGRHHGQEDRDKDLGTLERQDVVHQLMFVGWASSQEHAEDGEEPDGPETKDRQHAHKRESQPHWVLQVAEDGLVKRGIMIKGSRPDPERRHGHGVHAGIGELIVVPSIETVSFRIVFNLLHVDEQVVPETVHDALDSVGDPLGHVRVGRGAVLDGLPKPEHDLRKHGAGHDEHKVEGLHLPLRQHRPHGAEPGRLDGRAVHSFLGGHW
mmetsp:Transcript_31612/g.91426  ORF Transcript_31612/g.91426 Transcript_31612/m.91426 type:complete len:221 (-) Transcript_31612:438-1100(-)